MLSVKGVGCRDTRPHAETLFRAMQYAGLEAARQQAAHHLGEPGGDAGTLCLERIFLDDGIPLIGHFDGGSVHHIAHQSPASNS